MTIVEQEIARHFLCRLYIFYFKVQVKKLNDRLKNGKMYYKYLKKT